jgi:hypothetical protein
MKKEIIIKLEEYDIDKLCEYVVETPKGSAFKCDIYNKSDILLLKKLIIGLGYKIYTSSNAQWADGSPAVEITTNYPYKNYKKMVYDIRGHIWEEIKKKINK